MKRRYSQRQRGIALMALLAILAIGATALLVRQLNAESGAFAAVRNNRNAEVLLRAKYALIGYVAAQAAKAGENNPGAMPCPENPADFDSTTGNDGKIGTSCGVTTVGRFPWRTLGLDKLVDASGEPLWYVVSPGWGVASGSNTSINSNSVGQLTVDGVPNAAVALIIAPGTAFSVPACASMAAVNQVRPTTGTPDWRNYLECDNATYPTPDITFVTTGPSGSFNDQVLVITVADVMPAIEAAIAKRIEREIVPALQTVYTPAAWGFAGTNPILPFAAPFASPGPGAGTSNYHGASGTYAGLLPFNQMRNCTVLAANPRCTSTVLTYSKASDDVKTAGSGSIRTQSSCSWQATTFVCTGEYLQPSISVTVSIKVANVAGGLRTMDATGKITCAAVDDVGAGIPVQSVACSVTSVLQSDGSIIFTVATGALPDIAGSGWGTYANYKVSLADSAASPIFGDHALLSSTDPGTCPSYGCTGWFVRNEWYRLLYYAVSPSNTAVKVATERSCSALPADCLAVTSATPPNLSSAALLILAGRSVNGTSRPSTTLADYLEFDNANAAYVRQPVTPTLPTPYVDTGAANAYVVSAASPSAGTTFQFRAVNSNTGTSTLTTPATGTKSLVNLDGSNLAASTIQASAAVQATYDGSQFLLSKRPFNDRFAAFGSN
jgi:hypothetical protein